MPHQLIQTEDGSITLYVPELNEHYHSVHGAIQESIHIFIRAGLDFYLTSPEHRPPTEVPLSILEAGFGTGLNAYLSLLRSEELQLPLDYHSVEKYPLPPEEVNRLHYPDQLPAADPGSFAMGLRRADYPFISFTQIPDRFPVYTISGPIRYRLFRCLQPGSATPSLDSGSIQPVRPSIETGRNPGDLLCQGDSQASLTRSRFHLKTPARTSRKKRNAQSHQTRPNMTSLEIKQLLDEKYQEYCHSDFFIHTDPIQIPKLFEEKEDIEIAGFLAASLAWGQRPTIIKKCKELMQLLDYAPYDFVLHARESDFTRFEHFKHRTFNGYDCSYFLRSLAHIYRHEGGLENVFTTAWQIHGDMFEVLRHWYRIFTTLPAEPRVLRHIACVDKGSAAKRVNMFIRWMVRHDHSGIDFGLWKGIPASALLIPLDLHTGHVSRELGLLTRKQNDAKAVEELTRRLREFDPVDPIRYDFALFGLGVFK